MIQLFTLGFSSEEKKGKNPCLHKIGVLMMSDMINILTIPLFLSFLWIFISLCTYQNKILSSVKKNSAEALISIA